MGARKSKYALVTATLPKKSTVEPERRVIVSQVQEEILAPLGEDEPGTRPGDPSLDQVLTGVTNSVAYILVLLKRAAAGERTAVAFFNGYDDARVVHSKLKEWTSVAQLMVDAYEELMVKQMEAEEVASMRLESGASVSTFPEPYTAIPDPEALRQWVLEDEDLAKKMTLPWATVNALNKERLLAGEDVLPGTEVSTLTQVRWGKA